MRRIQEKHHPYITGQDKIILMQNFDQLRRRIKLQKDMLQEIQDAVRRKEIDKNFKESDINNLKPEIKLLQTEKGTKLRWLNQRGWDQTRLNDILEMANTDEDGNQDEALYATYAMLHTYREEADYQKISEAMQRKKPRSLPPPPPSGRTSPDLESTLSTSTLARFSLWREEWRETSATTAQTSSGSSCGRYVGAVVCYAQLQAA
eukprot:Em0779g2a